MLTFSVVNSCFLGMGVEASIGMGFGTNVAKYGVSASLIMREATLCDVVGAWPTLYTA